MATRKGRRYPAPTGQIQGGGHIGGSDLTDEDLAALQYFSNQGQQQDPIDLIMQLYKMQQGEETTAADRALKERMAEAEEMWRRGQLEQGERGERRLASGEEESKRRYEEGKTIAQRYREEDLAREKEKETLALSEKEKDRIAAEKKQKVSDLDTMVERGIITKEQAIPYYNKINPEYAEVAKGIKAQVDEAAFKKGMGDYAKLSPKDRTKALPESFGGEEVFQRIKNAAQGYTYEPGGPSAMPGKMVDWKPQLEPAVSEPPMKVGYGRAAVEAPPAYSYTIREPAQTSQTIPAVGGMTEPTFAYGEGYPSAQPNYNVQTPAPSFIDSVMAKWEDARRREALEPKREWYPDLGTAALPPGTLPPELLLEPTTRPLGY